MEDNLVASATANDCLLIDTAPARLSKTVLTSGSGFASPVPALIDEMETSCAATEKVKKEVAR